MLSLVSSKSLPLRVVALLVGLMLLECVTRGFVWHQRTVYEEGVGYVLAPGTWLWAREGWASSTWEAHGVRRAPSAGRDAARVLVVGDSFTEAVHVGDEAVYSNRIVGMLGTAHPISVSAVGRSGGSLPHYIASFPSWNRHVSPDVVVVQLADADFVTDAWDAGKTHFVVRDDGGIGIDIVRGARYQGATRVLWEIRQRSMTLGILPARITEYIGAVRSEPPLFRAGWATARAAAGAAPRMHPVRPQLDALRAAFGDRMIVLHLPTFDPFNPTIVSPVEAELRNECLATSTPCAFTREALSNYLRVSRRSPFGFGETAFGEGHLNPGGHRVVARVLARALDELLSREL